jgi:hydrogenase maturation protease
VKKILVIGYGNTLRSDDGVGVWIAERIAELHLPEVDVKTFHQLFPDLAADMLPYETVIFIDASADGEPTAVRKAISPPDKLPSSNHNVSPELLQQLAWKMYDAVVNLQVYTVRGENFEFGSALSPAVEKRASETVILIASQIQQSRLGAVGSGIFLN